MNRVVEILAPAGSMECLQAAIAAGADAVYLGGTRFGARAYAQNLSEEEIQQAELLLTKISDNAYSYIQNRRLKSFGNTDK